MAQLNFNAAAVEPDKGVGDPVPSGWYIVAVDESDVKPTKAEGGFYLECRFNILDGAYQGRKLFARFNLRNANAQATEIGQRQLSALAHAVGVMMVNDSQDLHGKPLKVKVKVRPAKDDYEPSNDITAYRNVNENTEAPTAAASAAHAQQPAAPAGWQGAPVAPPQPQGWAPPGAPAQAPAGAPTAPWNAPPAQAQPPQPVYQQPPQQPIYQAPPQQPVAPAAAPGWQAPQGGQPWQQPAQPQQPAPVMQQPPQPVQHPAQSAVPPWQRPA